jgi:hypothetical protein
VLREIQVIIIEDAAEQQQGDYDQQPADKCQLLKWIAWLLFLGHITLSNGEHEPRDAAATGSRMQTDRTGCLRLALRSGFGSSSDPSLRPRLRNYQFHLLCRHHGSILSKCPLAPHARTLGNHVVANAKLLAAIFETEPLKTERLAAFGGCDKYILVCHG